MDIKIDLTNPAALYTVLWGIALGLTALSITTNLAPMNGETVALVLSTMVIFPCMGGLHILLFKRTDLRKKIAEPSDQIRHLQPLVRKLLLLWGIGSLAEIAISGGLPLFWIFLGSPKNYADFGIQMVHGLLMAIFMFASTAIFLDYLQTRSHVSLRTLCALATWPILLMSRGAMMWLILQLTCVYLFKTKIQPKTLARFIFTVFLIIWIFGAIGDLRMGENHDWLQNLIKDEHRNWVEKLPSGFLWVYLYITASLNNIVTNIRDLQPGYSFYYSSRGLIPSTLRDIIFDPSTKFIELSIEAFNTSTFFENFLRDFGVPGTVAVVGFLQFLCIHVYRIARRGEVWALIAYAVCFQALSLSIFTDNFTSLPNLAQILLALLCGRKIARRIDADPPAQNENGALPLQSLDR